MRMVASRFLRFRCSGSIGFKPWVSVPAAQRQIAFPARDAVAESIFASTGSR